VGESAGPFGSYPRSRRLQGNGVVFGHGKQGKFGLTWAIVLEENPRCSDHVQLERRTACVEFTAFGASKMSG
jgi:hypothetical protein